MAVSKTTVATPEANSVEPPVATPSIDEEEETELARLYPVRDKMRRLEGAVFLAEEMYGTAMKTEEPDNASSDLPASDETVPDEAVSDDGDVEETNSTDVPNPARPRGLKRTNLAQAESNVFPKPTQPDQDQSET